jgi:arylsulfatase A-like enzyme
MAAGAALAATAGTDKAKAAEERSVKHPNVVFVFGDQWRGQATGYAGDPNAITPHLDKLAAESINFTNAVSGCPVCTPYRASLMTGQYWLTHGAFVNDVCLRDETVSIAEAYNDSGYDTAYIGKWHIDGHGRSSFIPRERRQGFQFWKVLECTHNYNDSAYYADENAKLKWDGYDAIAQTREAQRYIHEHNGDRPFALVLSWGPPHAPYHTAPEKYRKMFDPEKVTLRPNVPEDQAEKAREELAGYYAHMAALDDCVADLLGTLKECGIEEDTVFVFTSDHGDMLHSQGALKKQQPYEESIMVPFLLRYPRGLGAGGREVDTLINTPDIAPTLLGLCGVPVPDTMEGADLSASLTKGKMPDVDAALLMCPAPFGQWTRKIGGREYRGVRTKRYTYCRDLNGPWLLYDNEKDPYQLENLCGTAGLAAVQDELDAILSRKLKETNDEFKPARYYIEKWGYTVDKNGTVPYTN